MKASFICLILALSASATRPVFAQINNAKGNVVGDKRIIIQQRTVGAFDQLSVDYAMKVRITDGNPGQVELEGESNVLPYVILVVKNGELTVALPRNVAFKETKAVTVTIHVAKLNRISATTASVITSEVPIRAEQLTVLLKEASKLTAPLAVQALKIDVQEASAVSVEGTAVEATIRLSGAGKLDAKRLTIANATVQLDGASNAAITVTKTLSASADGVSTITYSGNPTVTAQEATGLSKIRKQG